ncbi:hypothetical protein KC19_VG328500 [Ceratodon purpureus]|uniref:Uncharacterized protein n=1 Tax=Ceratodon purpureus TaxID=3225 RepID=A0A8T0HWJ1_CERPU|nr:hypothetical protein KC19_VG328500 [Ceratodon purpureus]
MASCDAGLRLSPHLGLYLLRAHVPTQENRGRFCAGCSRIHRLPKLTEISTDQACTTLGKSAHPPSNDDLELRDSQSDVGVS